MINASCPFSGDIYQSKFPLVIFRFTRLTPRDYRVNLDNRVTIDHQLTYAPLKTEPFLLPTKANDDGIGFANRVLLWFSRRFHDPTFNGGNLTSYGTILVTSNRPNNISSEYSGNILISSTAQEPAYDLYLYPAGDTSNVSDTIYPSLRRDNS